jgi:hypothetical protein
MMKMDGQVVVDIENDNGCLILMMQGYFFHLKNVLILKLLNFNRFPRLLKKNA